MTVGYERRPGPTLGKNDERSPEDVGFSGSKIAGTDHVCMCVYICIYTYVYIWIYIYIYMYIYIYI